jgi:hypothetical protein
VDLVRQSNSLTDLFSNGLKGGVSRYTDILNPLARSGKENSYGSSVLGSLPIAGTKLGELLALYHNPSVAVPLAAGYGIGRGIDAITGRRSTVAKFVTQNRLDNNPGVGGFYRSIYDQTGMLDRRTPPLVSSS